MHHESLESGLLYGLRSWFEALVLAFALAMFVRTFVFELFKVPTGSMTPTIIGGQIIETDWNHDGKEDLLVVQSSNRVLTFLREGERLVDHGFEDVDPIVMNQFKLSGELKNEYHRIFVNKFAYWFRDPRRGEIIVFKVPDPIWNPAKPFYIKRCVGLPGDELSFSPEGKLQVAGRDPANDTPFFGEHKYKDKVEKFSVGLHRFDYVEYEDASPDFLRIKKIHVPEDNFYVMGDNTSSSLDSRYWGCFEGNRLKGKAFFRYWPLKKISFLN